MDLLDFGRGQLQVLLHWLSLLVILPVIQFRCTLCLLFHCDNVKSRRITPYQKTFLPE